MALGLVVMDVSGLFKEEMLEDRSKMSKGVYCKRKQDHVLVKDVADDCVTNGGDAHCWVDLLSHPNFFFLCSCRY